MMGRSCNDEGGSNENAYVMSDCKNDFCTPSKFCYILCRLMIRIESFHNDDGDARRASQSLKM